MSRVAPAPWMCRRFNPPVSGSPMERKKIFLKSTTRRCTVVCHCHCSIDSVVLVVTSFSMYLRATQCGARYWQGELAMLNETSGAAATTSTTTIDGEVARAVRHDFPFFFLGCLVVRLQLDGLFFSSDSCRFLLLLLHGDDQKKRQLERNFPQKEIRKKDDPSIVGCSSSRSVPQQFIRFYRRRCRSSQYGPTEQRNADGSRSIRGG